jgi:O-antigen/teichoic acid export membrane protein
MTGDSPTSKTPRLRLGSGTAHMLVATFVSAGAAFLYLVIVGRALGPNDFAPITVLWTVQYLATTVVYLPIEQLTVRRLSQQTPEATPWTLYLWVTTACTIGALAFGIFTLHRFFAGDAAFLPILALLAIGYAGFGVGRGYLAGQRRFKEYAYAVSAESLLRLCLAGALLAAGAGALGLSWAMAAAPFVIWLWRPLRGRRHSEAARRPERGATASLGAFISANAASQTMLAAGPLVVGALGGGAAQVSVIGQTFLLLRAPLAVAGNMISRVMPPLTRFVETAQLSRIRRLGLEMGIGGFAVSAGGFAAGYLAGPGLVSWLMGPEYRPGALLAALAAAGTALATVAIFAQQILVAMGSTGRLAVAWLCGLGAAAAVVVAAGGSSPFLRVGWAFMIGESLAFTLLIGMVVAAVQGRPPPEPYQSPEPAPFL